jgi:hypothetical protein
MNDIHSRLFTFALHAFVLALVAVMAERGLRLQRQRIYRIALRAFIAGAVAAEAGRIIL